MQKFPCSVTTFSNGAMCGKLNIKQEAVPTTVEEFSNDSTDSSSTYHNLQPAKDPTLLISRHFSDDETFTNWEKKHPELWDTDDVSSWIYSVASENKFEFEKLSGEKFNSLTGAHLCRMFKEQFIELDPCYGAHFFESLKLLQKEMHTSGEEEPMTEKSYLELLTSVDHPELMDEAIDGELENEILQQLFNSGDIDFSLNNGHNFPLVEPNHIQRHRGSSCDESGYSSEGSSNELISTIPIHQNHPQCTLPSIHSFISKPSCYNHIPKHELDNYQNHELTSTLNESSTLPMKEEKEEEEEKKFAKRSPGRPRKKFIVSEDGYTEIPKTRKPSKAKHLWKFVLELLKDSSTNPRLVRWENKQKGIFRFMKSEEVARRWGKFKNNPSMTYEKMSRSMRFCRTSKVFGQVPKGENYPKKLTFRFGEKAYGWQDV